MDGKSLYEQPALSPELQEKQDQKFAIARLHMEFKQQKINRTDYINGLKELGADKNIIERAQCETTFTNSITSNDANIMPMSLYTSNYISDLYQQTQQTSYWCGPATASEIIRALMNNSATQSQLISDLHCTTSGTPWYDGTYPMVNTLNKYSNSSYYTPYGTTVEATDFQVCVVADIDNQYGVAGNAWEVAGTSHPHLTGHPVDRTIYHWIAIDGYTSSGSYVHYADSACGLGGIWANVPAYSSLSYTTLARIMNGRGIVW